jgi:cytochrome b pre-mRNA-processing protein 3
VFGRLFRRDPASDRIATALYGAIVAQARNPAIYAGFGVADTVDGRFEMVVLHAVLVLERLRTAGAAGNSIGQEVFDLYCLDMDRSLRELGVGDLGVPKRMKAMTERFYGRAAAYRAGLVNGDSAGLTEALARNVFGRPNGGAALLAAYARACFLSLAATEDAELGEGRARFADPADFVAREAVT